MKPKHEENILDKAKSQKRQLIGLGALAPILTVLVDNKIPIIDVMPWLVAITGVGAAVLFLDDAVKTWRDVQIAKLERFKPKESDG